MFETALSLEIDALLANKVEDILALLDDVPADQLNAILAAEQKAKNRSGVAEAITAKIAQLETQPSPIEQTPNKDKNESPAPKKPSKSEPKKAMAVDMLGRPLKKS